MLSLELLQGVVVVLVLKLHMKHLTKCLKMISSASYNVQYQGYIQHSCPALGIVLPCSPPFLKTHHVERVPFTSIKRPNTNLAAKGALAHCLQCRTARKIQYGCQGAPEYQTGSGKVSTPRFLGILSNFRKISFLIQALIL